jgi:hypothetical protein
MTNNTNTFDKAPTATDLDFVRDMLIASEEVVDVRTLHRGAQIAQCLWGIGPVEMSAIVREVACARGWCRH